MGGSGGQNWKLDPFYENCSKYSLRYLLSSVCLVFLVIMTLVETGQTAICRRAKDL